MKTFQVEKTQKITHFINFLEKNIFHCPILSISQFNRGASSYNYLIETATEKKLVKIAWKHKKKSVNRLAQIIQELSQNQQLPIARIIPHNTNLVFKYQGSYGLVLEYMDGTSLPSYKMKKNHFEQVLKAYASFKKTVWKKTEILLPAYHFDEICQEYTKNCEHYLKRVKNKIGIKYFLAQRLLKILYNQLLYIQKTPLKMNPEKITIIHGDFHNNNILFKNNALVAFLDFEDTGYGYTTEDLMRFILCLTARLPIFISKKRYTAQWLNLCNKYCPCSREEWLLGLNSFALQKIKKSLDPKKRLIISFKYINQLFRLILFLKHYKQTQKTITQIIPN